MRSSGKKQKGSLSRTIANQKNLLKRVRGEKSSSRKEKPLLYVELLLRGVMTEILAKKITTGKKITVLDLIDRRVEIDHAKGVFRIYTSGGRKILERKLHVGSRRRKAKRR